VSDADAAAIDRLPADARKRLDELAGAIERVPLDDLPLYADRRIDDEHLTSVETAARMADEAGLTEGIRAAQRALTEGVVQMYGSERLMGTIMGMSTASPAGSNEDRVRILESLGDAVAATVLGDRLDPDDHAELLGLWARLLP
jgi:hypothetical protein